MATSHMFCLSYALYTTPYVPSPSFLDDRLSYLLSPPPELRGVSETRNRVHGGPVGLCLLQPTWPALRPRAAPHRFSDTSCREDTPSCPTGLTAAADMVEKGRAKRGERKPKEGSPGNLSGRRTRAYAERQQ
jgi:hypothetical protein